ncbi:MAG: hypothetical protein J0M21_10945, partial [Xanthomonadales bacterium]|nr:hypothetical protein [Xanthomonadales bacterium]
RPRRPDGFPARAIATHAAFADRLRPARMPGPRGARALARPPSAGCRRRAAVLALVDQMAFLHAQLPRTPRSLIS